MITIVPLAFPHLAPISRLHLDHLPTDFRGRPGVQLLSCYYDSVITTDAACGYVAIDQDQVAGFVCGVWNPDALRASMIKQHSVNLLIWGACQVIVRPAALIQLAGKLFRTSDISAPEVSDANAKPEYELRPIVVDPQFRGTGIAQRLVQRLLQDASQRGFPRLFLVAEAANAAANAFYRKVGFSHMSTYQVGPIAYLRYEIATGEGAYES